MFSFIGASLASGSQRFIAYSIGKNDKVELKDVFDSTVSIYLCLGIVALIIIEVIGLWLLNSKMQIPSGRILAANWVFQFSALAFIINLIAIPYNSVVIAHEKMDFFAYLSIFEGGANLILALLLPYVFIDKLIFYAALVSSCSSFIVDKNFAYIQTKGCRGQPCCYFKLLTNEMIVSSYFCGAFTLTRECAPFSNQTSFLSGEPHLS